jgi:hypothetical protein
MKVRFNRPKSISIENNLWVIFLKSALAVSGKFAPLPSLHQCTTIVTTIRQWIGRIRTVLKTRECRQIGQQALGI